MTSHFSIKFNQIILTRLGAILKMRLLLVNRFFIKSMLLNSVFPIYYLKYTIVKFMCELCENWQACSTRPKFTHTFNASRCMVQCALCIVCKLHGTMSNIKDTWMYFIIAHQNGCYFRSIEYEEGKHSSKNAKWCTCPFSFQLDHVRLFRHCKRIDAIYWGKRNQNQFRNNVKRRSCILKAKVMRYNFLVRTTLFTAEWLQSL